MNAVETDNVMLLNNFFASDFPVDFVNKEGKSLLVVALENDSQKVLDMLLARGVYLERTFEEGKTPIFYVRSLNALEQIVKAGADINLSLIHIFYLLFLEELLSPHILLLIFFS